MKSREKLFKYLEDQTSINGVIYKFMNPCKHRYYKEGHDMQGLLQCGKRQVIRVVNSICHEVKDGDNPCLVDSKKPFLKFYCRSEKVLWFTKNPYWKQWFMSENEKIFFSQILLVVSCSQVTFIKKMSPEIWQKCHLRFGKHLIYITHLKEHIMQWVLKQDNSFLEKFKISCSQNTIRFHKQNLDSIFILDSNKKKKVINEKESLQPISNETEEVEIKTTLHLDSKSKLLIFARSQYKSMTKEQIKIRNQARKVFSKFVDEADQPIPVLLQDFTAWYSSLNKPFYPQAVKQAAESWIENRISGRHDKFIEVRKKKNTDTVDAFDLGEMELAAIEVWEKFIPLSVFEKEKVVDVLERMKSLGMEETPAHAKAWTERFVTKLKVAGVNYLPSAISDVDSFSKALQKIRR